MPSGWHWAMSSSGLRPLSVPLSRCMTLSIMCRAAPTPAPADTRTLPPAWTPTSTTPDEPHQHPCRRIDSPRLFAYRAVPDERGRQLVVVVQEAHIVRVRLEIHLHVLERLGLLQARVVIVIEEAAAEAAHHRFHEAMVDVERGQAAVRHVRTTANRNGK
eukprot:scaffold109_cov252-Pinguiococcus_pyrenoidosus.AAC.20